jgi:hypothetical protein
MNAVIRGFRDGRRTKAAISSVEGFERSHVVTKIPYDYKVSPSLMQKKVPPVDRFHGRRYCVAKKNPRVPHMLSGWLVNVNRRSEIS